MKAQAVNLGSQLHGANSVRAVQPLWPPHRFLSILRTCWDHGRSRATTQSLSSGAGWAMPLRPQNHRLPVCPVWESCIQETSFCERYCDESGKTIAWCCQRSWRPNTSPFWPGFGTRVRFNTLASLTFRCTWHKVLFASFLFLSFATRMSVLGLS